MSRACVIGSGPNGLAAAIVLAQAGVRVDVFEAEAEAGGAARTMPLTLPGFLHDFGSAVHPFAVGSPFFSSLPLADYGLEWVHGSAPLAHPLDDGSAVVLERNLGETERALGEDGKEWRRFLECAAADWKEFADDALGPVLRIPHHPLRMARFGLTAFQSARSFTESHFSSLRTRAVFAGLAGHSFLSLDQPLSATIGLLFAVTIHACGWPIPRGGAQALSRALIGDPNSLGGTVHTSRRIGAATFASWKQTVKLSCSIRRRELLAIAGDRIAPRYRRAFSRFQPGPGAFKVDYGLSEPRRGVRRSAGAPSRFISVGRSRTWRPPRRRLRSGARWNGHLSWPLNLHCSIPPARRRASKCLWAYCHVPNGSAVDMTGLKSKHRSNGSRRDFAIAFWLAASRPRRRLKRWMPTFSAATLPAEPSTCGHFSLVLGRAATVARRLVLVLRIDAARWRCAWHVRLSRGAVCVADGRARDGCARDSFRDPPDML